MSLRSLFEWLDALPSSLALRESLNAYPILLTSHVVSMCLFVGLIAFWDLRLVGITLKKRSGVEHSVDASFRWRSPAS